MTPIEEIAAERQRQRDVEGWTLYHDDEHTDRSLAAAAAAYAYHASLDDAGRRTTADAESKPGYFSILKGLWPRSWDWQYWKPKNRRRDLVRAGALIVAELERMNRMENKKRNAA